MHTYWMNLRAYYRDNGYYPFTYVLVPFLALLPYAWSQGTPSTITMMIGLSGLCAFLFLPSLWWPDRLRQRLVPVLALCAFVGTLVVPAAVFLHLLALFTAGRLVSFSKRMIATLLVILVATSNAWWIASASAQQDFGYWWFVPPLFILLAGLTTLDSLRERRAARLRLASEEAECLAATSERERIARDLHDLLGRNLSLIAVKSGLVAKLAPHDLEHAMRENEDVKQIATTALTEVRQMVDVFRGPRLRTELATARLALATVGATMDLELGECDMTEPAEEGLAYALREAVTNVVRHAGASRCVVRLSCTKRAAVLEVHDNGSGQSGAEGSGLLGMRERLEALGGSLERSFTHGTYLRATVPLAATSKRAS